MATKNYTLHVKEEKYPAVVEHLSKQKNVSAYILNVIAKDIGAGENTESLKSKVEYLEYMFDSLKEYVFGVERELRELEKKLQK